MFAKQIGLDIFIPRYKGPLNVFLRAKRRVSTRRAFQYVSDIIRLHEITGLEKRGGRGTSKISDTCLFTAGTLALCKRICFRTGYMLAIRRVAANNAAIRVDDHVKIYA